MQTVGQFDQDHARVVVQGQQDTLEILGLETPGSEVALLVLVFVVQDVLDLGQAVHQRGDLVAEAFPKVFHRIIRILHHIVQKGGGDGLVSESDIVHDDLRHGDGMEHVRLPATAADILVRLVGELECLPDDLQFPFVGTAALRGSVQHVPVPGNHLIIFLCKLGITHRISFKFRWFTFWKE